MLDTAGMPNTPDWWLLRLGAQLGADRPRFDELYQYWRGDHPLPFGNKKMREAYRRHQKSSRTNFVKLVSESVTERLNINGFRVGAGDDADAQAWSWWTANNMASNSSLVHRAASTMSRSYVIVGPNPDDPSSPLVTGEDPRQVIHESSSTNRRKVLAALKTYRDDQADRQLAAVFLPDAVYYYRSVAQAKAFNDKQWTPAKWEIDDSVYPDGVGPNPLGEVPVVPFYNMPDLTGQCLGEFEDVTPIQDRINTEILDRMVVSAMQAYRQRWVTGMEMTDENGNASNDFDPGADLVWGVPDEKAKFGDFDQVDLTGILAAVEADITHLAAITRTPPSYLLGAIVNASGDALAMAETGLVSKVTERASEFGQSWVAVHRLASKLTGQDVADDVQVLWEDPQFRTLTEMAAAAVQLMTAGVPWRTRMVKCGFSPGEIDRMQTERAMDALLTPNPDYTIPGAPLGTSGSQSASAPGAPGGAAQPAADVARAASPNRTGAPA